MTLTLENLKTIHAGEKFMLFIKGVPAGIFTMLAAQRFVQLSMGSVSATLPVFIKNCRTDEQICTIYPLALILEPK